MTLLIPLRPLQKPLPNIPLCSSGRKTKKNIGSLLTTLWTVCMYVGIIIQMLVLVKGCTVQLQIGTIGRLRKLHTLLHILHTTQYTYYTLHMLHTTHYTLHIKNLGSEVHTKHYTLHIQMKYHYTYYTY